MTSNKGMIRARIRREGGRRVELGHFKTKAEVAAAQKVAHVILDELDAVKKQPRKLPSPQTLVKMIGQGRYDSEIGTIAQIAVRRTNLIKSLVNDRNRKWTGAAGSLANDAKWQGLQDAPKDSPIRQKVLADELRNLGFDPANIGPTPPKQQKSLGLDPPSNLIG